MASTYSDLKIELIGTGDQSGTWGITTNSNLGNDGLGAAIAGSADVSFSSADVTLTLTDTVAAQSARNLRLNLTGTTGGARNLILGSGCQIEKPYLINNGTADTVTVKNTSGTGIAVPAGKSMWVYNDGTNVVDAVTHLSSLTLGSALPVASGGTGATTLTSNNVVLGNGTSAVQFVAPGTTGNVLTSNGTTWTSAAAAPTVAISNDTSTASDLYPAFMGATSGTASTIYTGNANLLYKPSTGELKSQVPVALNGLIVNSQTIAANYTIASGYNALSAGPVSVSSGITVTVSSGSVWAVI